MKIPEPEKYKEPAEDLPDIHIEAIIFPSTGIAEITFSIRLADATQFTVTVKQGMDYPESHIQDAIQSAYEHLCAQLTQLNDEIRMILNKEKSR